MRLVPTIFALLVACSSAKASNPPPNVNVYVPPAVDATRFFTWLDSVQLKLTLTRTPASSTLQGFFQAYIQDAQVEQADGTKPVLSGQGQTCDEAIGAYLHIIRGHMLTVGTNSYIAPTDIVN